MEQWSIQKSAMQILSDGMHELLRQPYRRLDSMMSPMPGNYLISLDKKGMYAGESLDIAHRLEQQSKPKTSTFYKNYLKQFGFEAKSITDFKVQTIHTKSGRKELEEFCIVNIPTPLNKLQLDKKIKVVLEDMGTWNDIQDNSSIIIEAGIQEVLSSPRQKWDFTHVPNEGGIYLIYYNNELIYIGETSCISERIKTHSGQTYFSAFRRNCGTILLNFTLKEKNGKKRYFTEEEDSQIDSFLKQCTIVPFPVSIGRGELEERLIKEFSPLLNKKGV